MPHGMRELPPQPQGERGMGLYRALDRLRLPGGYAGKFFALGFVAVHLPLLAALGVAAPRGRVDWVLTGAVLLATLLGTGAARRTPWPPMPPPAPCPACPLPMATPPAG